MEAKISRVLESKREEWQLETRIALTATETRFVFVMQICSRALIHTKGFNFFTKPLPLLHQKKDDGEERSRKILALLNDDGYESS